MCRFGSTFTTKLIVLGFKSHALERHNPTNYQLLDNHIT